MGALVHTYVRRIESKAPVMTAKTPLSPNSTEQCSKHQVTTRYPILKLVEVAVQLIHYWKVFPSAGNIYK